MGVGASPRRAPPEGRLSHLRHSALLARDETPQRSVLVTGNTSHALGWPFVGLSAARAQGVPKCSQATTRYFSGSTIALSRLRIERHVVCGPKGGKERKRKRKLQDARLEPIRRCSHGLASFFGYRSRHASEAMDPCFPGPDWPTSMGRHKQPEASHTAPSTEPIHASLFSSSSAVLCHSRLEQNCRHRRGPDS